MISSEHSLMISDYSQLGRMMEHRALCRECYVVMKYCDVVTVLRRDKTGPSSDKIKLESSGILIIKAKYHCT